MVVALLAVSCTNEEPVPPYQTVNPVKNPVVTVWSGNQTFGNSSNPKFIGSRSTSSDLTVNGNYFKICDYGNKSDWMRDNYPDLYNYYDNAPKTTDRGESVSQHEYDVVMEYLKTHPNEGSTECDLTTYFIQNVGSSFDTYEVEYIDGNGNVHHTQSVTGGRQMDYFTIDGAHVPDYNATDGKRALIVDVPLNNPTYHDSYGTIDNIKYDSYRFYYIEVDGVLNCYLCFDYKMKKWDNGDCDYTGDGVYSDWVIKIVPADGSEVKKPGEEQQEPVTPPTTPTTPPTITDGDEVEINLSLNDSHDDIDDLTTKLSIHVRAATDVEVFIPVPARYYCEADDLDIVLSHQHELVRYGYESVAEYVIGNNKVTLTVKFEEDGIRVTTDGINQEVIDYCFEHYGDGINFEVWNYFNDDMKEIITREELMGYLNQATVKFLDKLPDYYINAFNDTERQELFEQDCTVSIVNEQRNSYGDKQKGSHYNGSEYNEIYKKN